MTRRLKIIIISIVVVLLLGIIALVAYPYLTTAQLSITTNSSDNTIAINRITPNAQSIDTENATGSFSTRVPAGTYSIAVKNKYFASQQVVNVKAMETKNITINLNSIKDVEPVSSRSASYVVADNNSLAFIDRSNRSLYRIDSNNNEQLIDSTHGFSTAEWSDVTYGVGQDTNSNLYKINNNTVTPIVAPFSYDAKTTYYLAPNRDLYIANGKTLYISTAEGGFKQLYVSSQQISVITASNTNVLLGESNPEKKEGALVAVSRTGSTNKSTGEAYRAAWSPSGKYLVTSSDVETQVVDAKLHKVISLPTTNVNSPVWLDDHTLLYGVSDGVWKYDVQSGSATLLASVGDVGQVSQITPSKDGAYIYISIQETNNTDGLSFQLSRLGLRGQVSSVAVQKIKLLIPNTISSCNLNYINFTKTTILVQGSLADKQTCLKSAQDYLWQYSVNVSQLQFTFVSI